MSNGAHGCTVSAASDSKRDRAHCFIRVASMDGVSDVEGCGTVAPAAVAESSWLIIPAAGVGGARSAGERYFVGLTPRYTLGGEQKALAVTSDGIVTVLPQGWA